jgi:hypothetical protein
MASPQTLQYPPSIVPLQPGLAHTSTAAVMTAARARSPPPRRRPPPRPVPG